VSKAEQSYRIARRVAERPLSTVQTELKIDELKLVDYGSIETSLSKFQKDVSGYELKEHELLIKLVGAPVNPADVNIIQGKYAFLPDKLPSTLGNEGAFEVLDANNSTKFKIGDLIVPNQLGWGTWRSHAIESENKFTKIPLKLSPHICASLTINPCTAYRLLHDFVQLSENDTIIQNGANSAVGQAVIQFAKEKHVNVINIVRKRENMHELRTFLEQLGAEIILTEENLRNTGLMQEMFAKIKKPRLALNCVGGKIAADMMRLVDDNAVLVTYGGMSKSPLSFNTADFIFKNLQATGFWLTAWRMNNLQNFDAMLNDVCRLIDKVGFKPPNFVEFKLDDYANALKESQVQFSNKKVLLVP
jgi:trans-2-enoyl-CoA reductase